ncbi:MULTISPECIES: energy-coupling factor ABC transporter ATP-binding protein [unclassified Dietzia]|uniref:energy-coupling factor ABC transporter ATP-binding protein n=1 Tax=unclassified Dietzia TaxID=2617939 RepID=UPI0013181337|nr:MULTISPECIES: ABC transporter ATP-binding protein [unclassified Dietzia]QGW23260.1 cobalt ABC transporter ATPase subunit [Dietzia sp. DQ12-45-1b]
MTVLALRGARFSYRRLDALGDHTHTVLDGADLTIRAGARLALLGGNGSGKTTLMRLLVGLNRLDAGELELDGERVRDRRADRTRLRQSVQMVLQEPDDQIFATTVRADVSFGPVNLGLDRAEVADRVDEALAALAITDLADRVPHHLSFGQRKRVALAGALAMRPRVLLLDEPTAGLDPLSCEDLLAALESLRAAGAAILMATHDVDLAWAWADDAVVLSGGALVRGPVHRVLQDEGLLAAARLATPWGAAVSRRLGRTVVRPGEV